MKEEAHKIWTEDFEYFGKFFMPQYENNKLSGKVTYSKGRLKFTLFESVHDPRTYITVRQNIAYQKEPEFSKAA